MTFQDFQETIIARCKEANACRHEFMCLLKAANSEDRAEFVRVLLRNHNRCIVYKIYYATMFLALEDQDVLLDAGLKTQKNHPIEFKAEKIGGKLWKPFNEGASAENGIGDYFTFDEANDPEAGRLVPSVEDFKALCALPSEWALYQGQFGRLFDNRLFIPAGGYRGRYGSTLYAVGNDGCSWSSSIAGTDAHNLGFGYSWLYPQGSNYRAYGLQVRCLKE